MARALSIMIKPSSGECNLNCGYCFYRSECKERERYSHGFMSYTTFENIVKKALLYTDGGDVFITFQGGEPLLVGKEFFRRVPVIIQRYNVKKSRVMLAIQTNGTLIDDEWCDILKGYLVGVSLDGTEELNTQRVTADGASSFNSVMRGISLLKKHNIEFNVLSVVTKTVANNIGKIYDTFKSWGIRYLQFIPCLKPLNEEEIINDMYMTGQEYGVFLWKLFKRYYTDFVNGNYISVRSMDNFVRLAAGKQAEQCGMNGYCTLQFVIEGDGEVYPCDFYCLDEWSLGNINDSDFESMAKSDKVRLFIEESMIIDDKCRECQYYRMCRNGCKRERCDIDKCTAYEYFFGRAMGMLKSLAPYTGR